jgi:DNA-directed RNA polymerase specialized sigma24 family protein
MNDEQQAVVAAIDEVERRFRDEHARHSKAMAELRNELEALVLRASELGVSVTALSKTLGASRGRVNRMLERLRVN